MGEAKENGTGGKWKSLCYYDCLQFEWTSRTKIKETHCQISLTFKNWKKIVKLKWFLATTVFWRILSLKLQIEIFWRKLTFLGFLPSLNWQKSLVICFFGIWPKSLIPDLFQKLVFCSAVGSSSTRPSWESDQQKWRKIDAKSKSSTTESK